MEHYEYYLPLVISALVVVLLGCWNPKCLQTKEHGLPSGKLNYPLVALLSFLSGVLGCLILHADDKGLKMYSPKRR